jgi:two-component system sensor histidine kinase AtoS
VDIGTLSATVAHELRNPLAVIAAAAFNIEKKAAPEFLEKIKKNIDAINKKITESSKIINNLLFYARIREPERQSLPVCSLLDEAISHAEERFHTQDIIIVKQCLFGKEQAIIADPLQLREVFDNIIGNAYEALVGQKGEISILLKPGEKKVAEIIIADNGPGISEKVIAKVFDPFFSTKSKGTGLGLSVCRQIVQKHGGMISIRSEEGQGTTVTISLPLAD